MPSVIFQNADTKPKLSGKSVLKKFIPVLIEENGFLLESIAIVFCSDEYLLQLNRQFLQHDYYTDILTFDLSIKEEIIGEIYISTDRVQENAIHERVSFEEELLRIIFHGVLHLCSFGDKTPLEKKIMTEKENEALSKYASFHVKQ